MLLYPDQSEARVGDRVLHGRDRALIEALIEGDEIVNWGVEFAGFMTACERCGCVFIVPGSADWEDVSLLSRVESPTPRTGGRLVLVVMPGGDGSAAFSPFIRRIYQKTLNDEWVVAQVVAPKWGRGQTVVWPKQSQSFPAARFSTEQLIDDVIDDVAARCLIDHSEVYILAWSSSGPAAYSIALRDNPRIAGAFIAMSVFNSGEYSKPVTTPVQTCGSRTGFSGLTWGKGRVDAIRWWARLARQTI